MRLDTSSSTRSAGTPESWTARLAMAFHSLNSPNSRWKILVSAAVERPSVGGSAPEATRRMKSTRTCSQMESLLSEELSKRCWYLMRTSTRAMRPCSVIGRFVSSFSATCFALASATLFAVLAASCFFSRSSVATASLARTFSTLPDTFSAAVMAALVFRSTALALACTSSASATSRVMVSSVTLFSAA